jgi:hypothetical protein
MKQPSKEKTIQGYKTFNSFVDQFGSRDIYTMIVLEEFFKELYGAQEPVSISGEEGQEGDQSN